MHRFILKKFATLQNTGNKNRLMQDALKLTRIIYTICNYIYKFMQFIYIPFNIHWQKKFFGDN